MAEVNFVTPLHIGTKRDYGARATADKGACAAVARQWGVDYWDGARAYGFGGMRYDGRWLPVAEAMARHYGLRAGDRVLDIGCGKGFLLYELTRAVPGLEVAGLDISTYAVEHAKPEVHSQLTVGTASTLPWPDAQFDLVLSINTLHNLYNYE